MPPPPPTASRCVVPAGRPSGALSVHEHNGQKPPCPHAAGGDGQVGSCSTAHALCGCVATTCSPPLVRSRRSAQASAVGTSAHRPGTPPGECEPRRPPAPAQQSRPVLHPPGHHTAPPATPPAAAACGCACKGLGGADDGLGAVLPCMGCGARTLACVRACAQGVRGWARVRARGWQRPRPPALRAKQAPGCLGGTPPQAPHLLSTPSSFSRAPGGWSRSRPGT